MENFDWRLIFEGISTLTRALPKDDRLRRWVVIGTVIVVAAAAYSATQGGSSKQLPKG